MELLQERVSLFSEVLEVQAGEGVSLCINTRNLFRAETPEAPRGEKLIMEAIREGKYTRPTHEGEHAGADTLTPSGDTFILFRSLSRYQSLYQCIL